MTFTHDRGGTPEEAWAGWDGLHRVPALDLRSEVFAGAARAAGLLVVAAHPDDETLGAGGLVAAAAQAEVPVTVLVATAGEASHPDSPTTSPQELARRRVREVEAAVAVLAPDAVVRVLDLPDGEVMGHLDRLRAAVADHHRDGGVIAAPWRGDGHIDHEAAGTAAAEVARRSGALLLEYPIWAWHWARPGDPRVPWAAAGRLELTPEVLRRKREAMALHVTQVAALSQRPGDEPLLSAAFLEHFERPAELVVVSRVTASPPPETPPERSLPAQFFDEFYATHGPDPWGFADRWYERRKRALTLAALPQERFARAFEPGCSIGLLTVELAARCDTLLATDIAVAAVAQARARTAGLPGVAVELGAVPADWPQGRFDLIVLSEVAYYCDRDDLEVLARRATGALTDDGVLLACHWRHPVPEYPLGGDVVHEVLAAQPGLELIAHHLEEDFRLDVLTRGPAAGVARRTGLVG